MAPEESMDVRVLGGLPLVATFSITKADPSVGYAGYEIEDLQLFDKRGKPANWAEARLSPKDWKDLECYIAENYVTPEREYDRDDY